MLEKSSPDSSYAVSEPTSERRSIVGRLLVILLVLAVLGGLMASLMFWRDARHSGQQNWSQGAIPVTATVAKAIEAPVSLDAVGALRAVDEVTLSPEAGGRIVGINFEAGDSVDAGALLVQLFDEPERADLAAAEAVLSLSELQLERTENLAPSGAASRDAFDQRRAERDQAAAAVAQYEARIRLKKVRAPFSGEIGIRRINLGQYLNAGQEIATLTALDRLFVEFALPQQHLSKV